MYCLTDEQIDYILNDIRRNGIDMEDLQLNLLDHICCIVEQGLEENGDFERFYASVIKTFYKKELKEIEEETLLLLLFKKYYTMKKIMIVSGLFSAAVLSFGIILKFMHAPGAAVCIVTGLFFLSFIFLPLMFVLKAKEKKNVIDRVLVGISAVCAVCISLSVLFKIQYWPGANMLGVTSLAVLLLLFLPIYFITGIRNPDTKVNTIVSSVLMIAGCGLFLTLVRSPKGSEIYYATLTSSFIRSEQILQNEQKQLGAAANNADMAIIKQGNKINELCEELKTYMVQKQTGYKTIDDDFINKKTFINDNIVQSYYEEPSLSAKIEALRQAVAQYNESAAHLAGIQMIPETPVIMPDGKRPDVRVMNALNDFNQMQMFVLQNERLLLAVR